MCCPLVFECSVGIWGFVIGLSQISFFFSFKSLKSDSPKVPKQAEAKRDGVIHPQNYNFNEF